MASSRAHCKLHGTARIFGIGLPKTGTSSLHAALKRLGFASSHFPHDDATVSELRNGQYALSILQRLDAVSDIPIPAVFPQLDEAWPGSKFILTVRDFDQWMASCRDAPFNSGDAVPQPGTMRDFYRTLLYGCTRFNEQRFAWVYHNHQRIVDTYFSGEKRKQLLVLPICDGAGWDQLCSFLGVDIPDEPFPHSNPKAS
jgi:hypothetical protein